MNIIGFEKLVKSEAAARRFLLSRCAAAGTFRCPRCSCRKLYEIESGKRRRCAQCGHSFNPFAGRYLDGVKLTSREWLWIIKLFELEAPATVAADETALSYPTAFKAYDTIRYAIAQNGWGGRPGRRPAPQRPAISGRRKRSGAADQVEPLPGDFAMLSIPFGDNCLILSDKPADFTQLSCCGHELEIVDYGRQFPRYRVYCTEKGYWPFAKERLAKHHGVSLAKLPWYLEETLFRWMNRRTPLFDIMVERLCSFIPPEPVPEEMEQDERSAIPA